jgi:hypothetical protein
MHCKLFVLAVAAAFPAAIAFPQEKPPSPPADHSKHASHGGFMQHGMSHARAKGVKLEEKRDEAAHVITLREGPMNLPAHTGHMHAAQPPDLLWNVPMDGWLFSYTPKLTDSAGGAVPGTLLHHTAFWNINRSDFLCHNKEEHIFGAGSEMNVWPPLPGFGYRVQMGDRIRIETMVYNPTATGYPAVWLEVAIQYAPLADPAPVRSVYPAWIDVQECGHSGYDLPPGKSTRTGFITLQFGGALLGVGGHLHDYGHELLLRDTATQKEIARLAATVDADGRLVSTPIKTFFETGGYALNRGDRLEVSATYDNLSGKLIPEGAMGIVVGYFLPVPDSDAAFSSLHRATKSRVKNKAR